MANEFSEKILTADGKNFIAQAASGNKIIYVNAITSTNYLDSTARLNESNYTGPSTTSVTTSSTNGTVRVVAEFENQASASVVKTVALVAKMESVYTENKIIMIQCDSEYGLYIPSLSDTVSQNTQLFFTLGLSQSGDVVEVTDGGHASKGDFDKLNERAVTTHSPNNPTAGENQTVYGQKTFKNTCTFDDTAIFHNILPSTTETYFLGNSENQWQSLYAINTVIGDTVYSDKLSPNSASSSVGTEQNPYTNIYATNGHFTSVNSGSLESGTITVSGNIVKSTSSTSIQTIGTSDNPFNTIYGTLSGNASTATKLKDARSIDGILFDGSSGVNRYATCTTSAEQYNKYAMPVGYLPTSILNISAGTRITVKFTYSNTSSDSSNPVTLRVGNSDAYQVYLNSTTPVGATKETSWGDGDIVDFIFDGSHWVKVNHTNYISGNAASASALKYGTTTTLAATNSSSITSYATVMPSPSGVYSLGTTSYKWQYLYCNYIGRSTNYVTSAYITDAYITNFHGTVPSAVNATNATNDSAGNQINTTYLRNVSIGSSSTSFVIYGENGSTSTATGTSYNKGLSLTRSSVATNAVDLSGAVASIISGTGVGSVRFVCFKTTALWTKKNGNLYVSGTKLHQVDLRTSDNGSDTIIRFDATTSISNSTLTGVWRLLNYIGSISSGNMIVALAVQVS